MSQEKQPYQQLNFSVENKKTLYNITIQQTIAISEALAELVKPGDTLLLFGEGKIDSVYELLMDPNDVPKILFKTGLGLKSDINRSSFLKGIFFTAALREILLRYIVDYEDFIECEVRKDYSQHFKNLINEVLPTQYSNDTENNTHNWINKAIRAFTNHPDWDFFSFRIFPKKIFCVF